MSTTIIPAETGWKVIAHESDSKGPPILFEYPVLAWVVNVEYEEAQPIPVTVGGTFPTTSTWLADPNGVVYEDGVPTFDSIGMLQQVLETGWRRAAPLAQQTG